ncbi:MAG: IclR family transcriptional regulator [Corynebacterium camporealensis]|uniref:IclR family transcriptional regulator n=1 Tax=Corynebacterium camporealensis TaxID=161896 RepID=UPI002A91782F|nr:IclR family transcriptional regulator [Corynebacterium camporealensis]MDY5839095.1 IclR family transcriptional regulator [Corynebacterium camporealensis]
MSSVSRSQVPAARNVLAILQLLSNIETPISASRIRAELDLPRSTTYHLLNEMVEAGFVMHLPEHRTYGLGLAAYDMAAAYSSQQPLVRLATRPLEKAATSVGGSGHLSRLAGSEVVYLQEVRAPGAPSLVTDKGVRLQAHRTASGRVMLAHLPEHEARAAYSTSGEVGEYRKLKLRLAEVRARGWELESEEIARGQATVAVPVLDHLDRPAAALAVTHPVSLSKAAVEQVLQEITRLAETISVKMYRSN